jgi:8-oxo-dGTP diphosphatase
MRDKPNVPSKPLVRRTTLAVDVVLFSPRSEALAVLLVRTPAGARERWALPWDAPSVGGESLEDAAARIVTVSLGTAPSYLEQIGTFNDSRRHPGDAELSVGVAALCASNVGLPRDAEWFPLAALPTVPPRHRAVIDRAAATIRLRVDQSPLAFRLLPPTFTLTDLQAVYELLLGRRLHKASFRRALQASYLVEPTDEWRSEGRGRPAQLFRYAPKKRRGSRRGVRFDLFSE